LKRPPKCWLCYTIELQAAVSIGCLISHASAAANYAHLRARSAPANVEAKSVACFRAQRSNYKASTQSIYQGEIAAQLPQPQAISLVYAPWLRGRSKDKAENKDKVYYTAQQMPGAAKEMV